MKAYADVFIDADTLIVVKPPSGKGRSHTLDFNRGGLRVFCEADDLERLAAVLAEYLEGRAKCAG